MTKTEKTKADLLFQALELEIQGAGCGTVCACVAEALDEAKAMRESGELSTYLQGKESLNSAVSKVAHKNSRLNENEISDVARVIAAFFNVTIRSSDNPKSPRRPKNAGHGDGHHHPEPLHGYGVGDSDNHNHSAHRGH